MKRSLVLGSGHLLSCMALLLGCSSDAESTSGPHGDQELAGAPLRADVKPISHDASKVGGCTWKTTRLEVLLRNAEAAARINETLKDPFNQHDPDAPTSSFTSLENSLPDPCDSGLNFVASETVTFNERGVLSVVIAYRGGRDDSVQFTRKNFDLTTGRVLELFDVLNHDGIDTIRSKCDNDDRECASLTYGVERGGIRINPRGTETRAYDELGFLVPWADLKGQFYSGPVKAIADRADW